MELQSDLNNERLTETIRSLMEENYDLGKLTRVKEIGECMIFLHTPAMGDIAICHHEQRI